MAEWLRRQTRIPVLLSTIVSVTVSVTAIVLVLPMYRSTHISIDRGENSMRLSVFFGSAGSNPAGVGFFIFFFFLVFGI